MPKAYIIGKFEWSTQRAESIIKFEGSCLAAISGCVRSSLLWLWGEFASLTRLKTNNCSRLRDFNSPSFSSSPRAQFTFRFTFQLTRWFSPSPSPCTSRHQWRKRAELSFRYPGADFGYSLKSLPRVFDLHKARKFRKNLIVFPGIIPRFASR